MGDPASSHAPAVAKGRAGATRATSSGPSASASADPPGAAEITAKVAAAWKDADSRAEEERCASVIGKIF